MKKTLFLIVALVMVVSMFAACGGPAPAASSPAAPASSPAAPAPAESSAAPSASASVAPSESAAAGGAEIAMITDIGGIDDRSFNQTTWEAVKAYGSDNNKTVKYYKPTDKTVDAYVAAIDLAVKGGAKIIVCPGYLFEPAIFKAQDTYPNIDFVLLDGNPNNGDFKNPVYKINKNVYSIFYAEQQSGFLAGYAAVKDGYTKLGFLGGMAVPAVVRYGYGFVQGAETAATEMGLKSIDLKYQYTGNFDATPENQTLAASWYKAGTEVIFACGGKVGDSVMAAAEANNGKVIGVDTDQSPLSKTVISSALKELGKTVKLALDGFYGGSFKGGVSETLDISVGAIGLPMKTSQFTKFTQADYDKVYNDLLNDTNKLKTNLWNDKTAATPDKLPVKIAKITFTK
jgi:basic membrane protein A